MLEYVLIVIYIVGYPYWLVRSYKYFVDDYITAIGQKRFAVILAASFALVWPILAILSIILKILDKLIKTIEGN